MGYAVAALPTTHSLEIRNDEFAYAVRARLLLPLFNPGDRDALPADDERTCRGCNKPTDAVHGWHMFTCKTLAPSVTRLSHRLGDAAVVLRRQAGRPDAVHHGKRIARRILEGATGRCGKLAVDEVFDRKPGRLPLEADDAYTAPGGTTIISDTHVIIPDRDVNADAHGAALEVGMARKTRHYEANYDVPEGGAKHMIYERFGAVHVVTKSVLAGFAKAKAQRLGIAESFSVLRTLQEFGVIFMRDLGYSMKLYAELGAPRPRPGAGVASRARLQHSHPLSEQDD